ncbi:hypothetical protein GDI3904 (plasmid) [Gluconacetobacter diazotrophicus PA1 5]|uniref:Uncharacterized protein n=1 Tax=Gluconacetobacter diazotrophicus (strain ATCC 49037 / DSM 5601 / CCUG 37298 / CIP 103539 / LMG 7603 / PAl5) TaxID=272568 RepID=A9HT73_GLUDA|nr:hypothetical protein GDI3904 [Gluconacetobacter diazotrophicus PA1 5]
MLMGASGLSLCVAHGHSFNQSGLHSLPNEPVHGVSPIAETTFHLHSLQAIHHVSGQRKRLVPIALGQQFRFSPCRIAAVLMRISDSIAHPRFLTLFSATSRVLTHERFPCRPFRATSVRGGAFRGAILPCGEAVGPALATYSEPVAA